MINKGKIWNGPGFEGDYCVRAEEASFVARSGAMTTLLTSGIGEKMYSLSAHSLCYKAFGIFLFYTAEPRGHMNYLQ